MMETAHLVELADTYMKVTGLKEVTLSHRVFGDSKKLAAIRGTADITVSRFNAALRWFDENWPETAAWPDHIRKPITPESFDEMLSHGAAA
jgi:hypothetical protein